MDSAVLFLRDVQEIAVSEYLNDRYAGQMNNWRTLVDGDPALYISFLKDPKCEMETERWDVVCGALGAVPSTCLAFDLSGRHFESGEPERFAIEVLERFPGCAMDDYSNHCWTLQELREQHQVAGHRFFKREYRD